MTKSNRHNIVSMHLSYYHQCRHYCCAITLLLLLLYANCYNCQTDATTASPPSATSSSRMRSVELTDPTGYFAPDSLHAKYTNKLTFSEYATYSSHSLLQVAGFDNDLHRYDNKQNLVDSFERNQSATSTATLGGDINYLANARYDSSEFELLHDQADATLVENQLNQEKCARQLDFLYEQALRLYKDYGSYTQSRRLDLIDLFDSYGPAPGEQLMMGNNVWLGSFQQCQRARVQMFGNSDNIMLANSTISGRYCVAHLRLPNESLLGAPTLISNLNHSRAGPSNDASGGGSTGGEVLLKLGICLPSACNSISMLRHSNRIEALIKLVRLKQVPYSSAQLTRLFCLPDENSPLRQLSLSARLFIALTSCWLALIVLVSIRYEYAKARQHQDQHRKCAINSNNAEQHHEQQHSLSKDKLVQIFAFRHAWQQLFVTGDCAAANEARAANSKRLSTSSQLVVDSSSATSPEYPLKSSANGGAILEQNLASLKMDLPKSVVCMKSMHNSTSYDEHNLQRGQSDSPPPPPSPPSCAPTSGSKSQSQSQQQLSAIDGIKVISMIWLISAHTLLLFIRSISNGRDFWSLLLDARFTTVLAGIFPVDSFFTITGVLTSYLKFNKAPRGHAARKELTKLSYWLEIFVHRYLRFMPMYLLIFWYTRDVSEYIGQGPMWDYATANTSLRSLCKRESVLVPLLFQANFKSIDQHCVKPAWYLANDYQYLLVTPFFIVLLLLSRKLGYLVIGLCISASLVLQFVTVYYPTADESGTKFSDFEALINFGPMFGAYVLKELWRLYVLPYNRIAPYLIGLLTGHLMYCHNKDNNSSGTPRGSSSDVSSSHASTESLALSSSNGSQNSIATVNSSNCETKQRQSSLSADRPSSNHNGLEAHTYPRANGTTTTAAAAKFANRSGATSELSVFVAFIRHYLNMNIWLPLVVLLSVVYSPLATKMVEPLRGEQAKVGASLLIALLRFAWSVAIARLIYVCFVANTKPVSGDKQQQRQQQNSSYIVDFLSSPKWKPWSKIGLSVLLIQWEVIGYLMQIQNGPPYMSASFLFTTIIGCIVVSYALGLLIYLTFEYPLSQIERLYIKPELFGKTKKQSSH